MARATPALPDPAQVRGRLDVRGRLAVKVTPGAREESVTLTAAEVLVKVRAPADRGAANDAVIAVVARALGLAPSRVRMVRGGAARRKLLEVDPD